MKAESGLDRNLDVMNGRILIVDDDERNRRLLHDLLEHKGHTVYEAIDGESALNMVREIAPDIVLLDVMMPNIDGFEVCSRLKQAPDTATIPVLMVTALKEQKDRLRGIEAGADDFITKPIDVNEVVLKVRNALRMKRLHDKVRQDLDKLRELEQLRDNLTHMIIHDMRSPLTVIMGGLQLAQDGQDASAVTRSLALSMSATEKLNGMVTSLLDISRMESGKMPLTMGVHDLATVARDAVEANRSGSGGDQVGVEVVGDSAAVRFDKDLIHRVFSNLIGNAIKFTQAGSTVEVRVRSRENVVRAEVKDTGCGIPEEYREKIFEKFAQVLAHQNSARHSTGLGLTFCKLAVEAHGGEIGVNSEVGKGSTFWFEIPTGKAVGA